MPTRIDLTNLKFGKLTVIREIGKYRNRPLWLCVCDCGRETKYIASVLRKGKIIQCKTCSLAAQTKHGCSGTTRHKPSREYQSWNSARGRCFNPRDASYHRYGGRGITMCDRWSDFTLFLADMGKCPSGYEIDRIDVNGDYMPENCRWVDSKTQANNRSVCKYYTHNGITLTATEWSEKWGKSCGYLATALKSGYSFDEVANRIETGLVRKKIKYRGENSAATKHSRGSIIKAVEMFFATSNIGTRKPKGTADAIYQATGIPKRYLNTIVRGKTNWLSPFDIEDLRTKYTTRGKRETV